MLLNRIFSAVCLIAILIVSVMVSPGKWTFISFVGAHLMVGFALAEYFTLVRLKGVNVHRVYATVLGLLFSAVVYLGARFDILLFRQSVLLFFILITTVFFVQIYLKENGSSLLISAATVAGVFYIAWLFSFFYKIAFYPGVDGRWFVFFAFLVTKSSDIMAYCVGSLVGKHPLAPKISPKKTVEGAVGGVGGAILATYIGKICFFPDFNLPGLYLLGLVMGLVGMGGDLVESLMKRDAQVKDSGRFIPGMGGALDVIDSLLFTAPVMYFYMRFFL